MMIFMFFLQLIAIAVAQTGGLDEAVKWEQIWTLESAETEEFTNSAKMEKALTDQQVFFYTDTQGSARFANIFISAILARDQVKYVGLRLFNRLLDIKKIADHMQRNGYRVLFGHVPFRYKAADSATHGLDQKELFDHF
uniref:Secreted protein n=1 Tax=Angiostrongylus cantonensis TaxID=6313 RepID=A0A158PBK6_ANGCA